LSNLLKIGKYGKEIGEKSKYGKEIGEKSGKLSTKIGKIRIFHIVSINTASTP